MRQISDGYLIIIDGLSQQKNRLDDIIANHSCQRIQFNNKEGRQMNSSIFNNSFGAYNASPGASPLPPYDKKNIPDYKKIFCAYHSAQFLTNFCIQKQCLMPLCPSCVVEHTEEHYQCHQKPTYVNLHEALQETKQKCYTTIIKLEQFAKKNSELSNYISGLSDYIRRQLSECKQKVFNQIEEHFDLYEKNLIQQVKSKYADDGVYNRKQSDQVREYIISQTQALYDRISQLKGDHCLATLIRYYEKDQKILQDQINQIVDYIDKNKKAGGLYITLNLEETQKLLEGFCERAVSLEYVQQENDSSFQSTKNVQNVRKGVMTSSIVNRVSPAGSGVNKSGLKQRSNHKPGSSGFKSREFDKSYNLPKISGNF